MSTLCSQALRFLFSECEVLDFFGLQSAQSAVCRPKKLSGSYSESGHLLYLKVWLQRVLISTLCSQAFRLDRCLFSECEVLDHFIDLQTAQVFSGHPVVYYRAFQKTKTLLQTNILGTLTDW